MVEYAHRVFHIWNVFPPTGMRAGTAERDWTWWAAEGGAIYYNTRVLVDLGYLNGNEHLRDDFNRYLREFLGTKNDAALAQAFKLWETNTDAYFFVTYRKGALVFFLLDALTRKVTDGNKTLDDLMRTLYKNYGGMKGTYSNRDLIRLLNSMTGFDFGLFFTKYVYGIDRLPLKLMPGDLTVDWSELISALKLSDTITATTASVSHTTKTSTSGTSVVLTTSRTAITSESEASTTTMELVTGALSIQVSVIVIAAVSVAAIVLAKRRSKKGLLKAN